MGDKTFLFFKIESWNFQNSLKQNIMKPLKISTHSVNSDNCYFHFFYLWSDWVENLRGFMKFFFKQILKVSAFYLEKKSFISKKIFLSRTAKMDPNDYACCPNFQWRFWLYISAQISTVSYKYTWAICRPQTEPKQMQVCNEAKYILKLIFWK